MMQTIVLWFIVVHFAALGGARRQRLDKAATGCQLTMTSETEGFVTSPSYPAIYEMKNCPRVIAVPDGQKIVLTLVAIDTYKVGTICNRRTDRVFVHERIDGRLVRSRTWCGTTIPADNTLTSTYPAVRIRLKPHKAEANYTNTFTGFNISISFSDDAPTETSTSTTTTTTTTSTSTSTTSTPTVPETNATTAAAGASCGKSKYRNAGSMQLAAPKIIGGVRGLAYEFPWMAVLYWTDTHNPFCGGTILDSRWIMTAAHCTRPHSPSLVEAGVHIKNVYNRTGAQIIQVDDIIYTNFNKETFENDIALLKLNADIVYSDETRPVCLPEAGNLYTHRKAIIAGWGSTRLGSGSFSDLVNFATLNITSNAECNAMMEEVKAHPLDVTDDMMCGTDNVGNDNRDTCKGDSGGPMTVKESDDRFHIVGITSWGYGCASGTPGVYTRVSRYLSWINAIINT